MELIKCKPPKHCQESGLGYLIKVLKVGEIIELYAERHELGK